MKLILATHNQKKLAELQRILAPLGCTLVQDIDLPEVKETGVTFAENARLKALSGTLASGLPCVGDDSGLCVDALGGAPGVYSARYAGEHGNDGGNITKLLAALQGVPPAQRTARFVCTVCCIFPDGREIAVRGECAGSIAFAPAGTGGFGYDPVFLPAAYPGRAMAELSAVEKDGVSHRGKALLALAEQLKGHL
ncbi:MAG: RdgB/HAM1 family non-canonical purine NTP pyrophosphatase [Oscillospiraceae bacterium]|jgi:XTP/dITP diphosphohydrolase|nr:RdgB/HAM1 family non-canonical purine NTP pyrophosphatase [Oscillospiraceae bacterium]